MQLPKGTFKGLARVVSPLSFWMAAGWAAYPYMMEHISNLMGEVVDMGEVRPFSMFMVIACIAAGIILAIYGFTGKDCADADLLAMGKPESLCPYCGANLPEGSGQCAGCNNKISRF
jgi:hypothetical protein